MLIRYKLPIQVNFLINFQILLITVIFTLSGCGGGGGGGGDTSGSTNLPTQISWIPPNLNTDGTDLAYPIKYRFYYGPNQTALKAVPELDLDAAGGSVSSLDLSSLDSAKLNLLTNLLKGNDTHFFAMTAINNQDVESGFSNIVSFP